LTGIGRRAGVNVPAGVDHGPVADWVGRFDQVESLRDALAVNMIRDVESSFDDHANDDHREQ
jgi:hypothetical protein